MPELHRIEWNHPTLGWISETACRFHEGELLSALSSLGMGCGGSLEPDRDTCDRCAHSGQRARAWLPARVQ